MADHLIPFQGKGYSGAINQNLLWRDSNIYLMDNHRAALWCWQQEIDLHDKPHSILHIDRHTDCLGANLEPHLAEMPDLRGLSITDYLAAQVVLQCDTVPLFRWDNYLSIHLAAFGKQVEIIRSVDHDDGDAPEHSHCIRPRADELPENLFYWLQSAHSPWIINVDLDYFFCPTPLTETDEEIWIPIYSDEYIETVFAQMKAALDSNLVAVITVCLTPSNFTPGWEECLELSRKIFKILGAQHPEI